jgi:hypothetical protein
VYRAHRFDSVGVVSIRIAIFFMAFREGQPTGWLGAGPQGLPEERAHAPQMPMRSRAPVGSYPEPDVEEVGPNNPSGIWHSAQVANFMKTVLLYVFMHTNAAVASGIQSLMKERRDLHDRVESGLLPGEQWTSWHTGPPPYASSTPPPSSYAGQGSYVGSSYAAAAPAAAAPGATAKELTLKKKAKANARHNHSD